MVDSTEKQGGRKLFYGLFLFPLVIAVGMAILLCSVVLLTSEDQSPESLITSIKTGSPSKRWQKAFELSNELNQGRGMMRASGVMKEVVHILNDRDEYDVKTRSYMAIALSHFKGPEAVVALRETLATETHVDVQLYLVWALGQREASEAAPEIRAFLKSDDIEMQKMAAYVLGAIKDKTAIPELKKLVHSPVQDVRWNASLSLARLGSDAGYDEILNMLDRPTLMAQEAITEAKCEEIMVNALKGLGLLGRKDANVMIQDLAKNDKSLKVRQAALEVLAL